jgi:hypothetical protein
MLAGRSLFGMVARQMSRTIRLRDLSVPDPGIDNTFLASAILFCDARKLGVSGT